MGQTYDLIPFDSPVALAQAAAEQWLALVQSASPPRLVALSGGRIARDFFNAAAEAAIEGGISLAGQHYFWADERCVPPEDAESNFALARRWLFEPLQIQSDQLHRIRGEIPP